MTVHLVRHGQSTWNVEGRLQGQTVHPELTERGRREAAEAAALLRARCPGTGEDVGLICSDLVRAAQTAAVIGQVLGVSVEQDVALREQGLGVLEGRLPKELVPEPTPEGLDITEVRWGGGESIEDVHDRLGTFFERVLPAAPPHLVLVTHGDTLRVARAWLQGRGHRDVDWDLVPNGFVTTLAVEAGRLRDQERLSRHQRRASGRTAGPDSIRSAH